MVWLRYVDDTFTIIHQEEINTFHEQNPDIQFTKEIEENGKLPFLDCLVIYDNNKIQKTTSETIARILQPYNKAHKPITTL